MRDSAYPVQYAGQQTIVTLPEHIDVSNAGQIREVLLSVINRGAATLIADMTGTVSCDHACVDAIVRTHQRAVAADTELRLAVNARIVRRVFAISGLDRMVSIYPSLDAATAARRPAPAAAPAPIRAVGAAAGNGAAISPPAVWKLVDALQDGVALVGPDGMIGLASTRLAEMFGYQHCELPGRTVQSLIPAHLPEADGGHRAGHSELRTARPMSDGLGLVGLRKDGTTFPAEIRLSPVGTSAGQHTLTVVRDVTQTRPLEEFARLAAAAITAEHARRSQQLLDVIITNLFGVGLGLQAAMALPAEESRKSIAEALNHLDDTIREIRDTAFATVSRGTPVGHV